MEKPKEWSGSNGTPRAMSRAPMEAGILKDFAPIWQHVAYCFYDDGSPRRPGVLSLRTLGSGWQMFLKDPDSGLQLVVHGPNVEAVFYNATLLLMEPEAPWEVDPYARVQEEKSKKK